MKRPSGHLTCPARPALPLAVVFAIAFLGGCDLSGRVYIAFFWAESETPDAFTCSAPNVPAFAAIARGRYYETIAGRYDLQYSYTTRVITQSLTFGLEADSTMLGQENAYYHATLHKSSPPTVEPFP
jgi:hypothetical protein